MTTAPERRLAARALRVAGRTVKTRRVAAYALADAAITGAMRDSTTLIIDDAAREALTTLLLAATRCATLLSTDGAERDAPGR